MLLFTCPRPGRGLFAARLLGGLLLLTLLLTLLLASRVQAQAPAWAWARNMTVAAIAPDNNALMKPGRVATDAAGNSYVLGQVAGAGTFGSLSLSNPIPSGGFLAKLDAAGNYVWVRGFTATGSAAPST